MAKFLAYWHYKLFLSPYRLLLLLGSPNLMKKCVFPILANFWTSMKVTPCDKNKTLKRNFDFAVANWFTINALGKFWLSINWIVHETNHFIPHSLTHMVLIWICTWTKWRARHVIPYRRVLCIIFHAYWFMSSQFLLIVFFDAVASNRVGELLLYI